MPTYPDLARLGRVTMRERLDAIFEQAYGHPEKRIWVAEIPDQGPVGMIWLQPSWHPVTELPDYMVLNLAVEPAQRGGGIGAKLLETARAFCAHEGVRRLRLFVGAHNEEAYRLYRRLGFEEQTREMRWEF